ncbi:MAG: glycosyltransferase family 1 protein [Carboxydocellales bacterium]
MNDFHKLMIGIDARPIQTHNSSGIPNYVRHLVKALAKIDQINSYRLFYNSFKDISDHIMELTSGNIENKISRIPNKVLGEFWDRFNFPPIENFLGIIDIFHATHFLAPPIKSPKLVVTIHDLAFVKFPECFTKEQGKEFVRRVRQSCINADMIISDSMSTKRDIIELFHIPSGKITVVPLAAQEIFDYQENQTKNSLIRNKYKLDKEYFLFVGTIEPRKNLVRLIQAYNRLPKDIKEHYHLVLAGGKGWLNKEIYTEAEQLGLMDEHVKFLGYVPDSDLPALLKQAIAFVYPSLYEGFGLPPLEAMASGVPVISSSISSIPEVVGEAGLLIDPYSVEEISSAMQKIIEDVKLASRLSKLGLARAGLFSWEETARATLDVYKKVSSEK